MNCAFDRPSPVGSVVAERSERAGEEHRTLTSFSWPRRRAAYRLLGILELPEIRGRAVLCRRFSLLSVFFGIWDGCALSFISFLVVGGASFDVELNPNSLKCTIIHKSRCVATS